MTGMVFTVSLCLCYSTPPRGAAELQKPVLWVGGVFPSSPALGLLYLKSP